MINPADILKASILIVDDQTANISMLEQMLRGAGYTAITSTRNPGEVCELYRQHRHDLILLDLLMPRLDGFAVMEDLKKIETGGYLPVLVITAHPDHKVRALKTGAKDFVSKPLDLTELLLRVHNMIEVRLLHRGMNLRNEARLELSQHIAGLGDWEYDFASDHLFWSEELYRILGISPQDFPPDSATFYSLVHPDDLALVRLKKKAAADGSPRVEFDHRIIRPGGEVRHIHQITTMALDAQGWPVRESGTLQDITPRKRAEETLRLSEERFAGAFEHAPSGMALVAPDGRWLRVNRALCDLLSYTEAELLTRTFQDITHPEDLALDLENVRHLLAGDVRSYHMEKRYIQAQGQLVTVLLNVSLVRDDSGRPSYFISHIQDITARKQTEVVLQREQALLSSIISTIPDHIYIKDRQSRFIRINASMTQRIGLRDPGEAVGKTDMDFFTPEHAQPAYQQEQGIMATGQPIIGLEEKETWADGSVTWASTTKVPMRNPAGEIVGLIGLSRDITERRESMEALRESDEKFRQLADNITDAFWIRSPDMNHVHYLSPAFEKIWGRSVASLRAKPHEWLEFILAEDRARVVAAYATLANGTSGLEIEYRIVRPTGEIRWVRVRAFQVRNAADQLIRHIGIVTDITESKQVHEHLLQAQKMEALGQFSGGVAHDFNNILAAIGGYTELARIQLQGNPTVREHLGSVIKATNRAADLVRQILTFSRQQPQTRVLLLLQPIVVESMKLMRATIPSTVEIEALIAADAPTVLGNANQIHQVLMNLAINGWHALKNLPGRLQVKLEKVEIDAAYAATRPGLRPGTYARLSVSDTGCGMDSATLRRIFEPFFTTKPPGEGTGLGLAVVHGIMDSHDGAVTVHSQPGEGTSFRLYFPEHVGETAAGPTEVGPTPHGHGECVLVVDDEEMLAQLGASLLTKLGYTTESTTESAKALDMVRADPARYALVLTDQTMPGMTGLQLASQIQDIRRGLPIMLMTGYNLSLTADRVGASGIRNILHKPFTMHSLGTAVHATLTGKAFQDYASNSPY